MPATPTAHTLRRGFTLIELLVVVSIMVLCLLVFAATLGNRSVGPALERTASGVSSMVANVRQNAASRKVHSELVFDYKQDRVIALARRRLASFAMEDETGSGDVIGRRSGGAEFTANRVKNLRDGKCLELPTGQASFTIPWEPQFEVDGDFEGIALAFDYCPMPALDAQGLPFAVTGNLVKMGSTFFLSVSAAREDSVRLELNCDSGRVLSGTFIACQNWHRVEIAISNYGASLWVDGRLDEGPVPAHDYAMPPPNGLDVSVGGPGGVPCRVDNLELFGLISSQTLTLEGCQLIPWDTDPMKEVLQEAENIYIDRNKPKGPTTGPGEPAPLMGAAAGLPNEPVPAIRHVYFDTSGKLDAARHPGSVDLHLVSYIGGDLRRMVLTFHPQGVMTSAYVDIFPWEKPPAANAPGGGG